MIKIVRKPSALEYKDPNTLGTHPNTVIVCSGFGVNPISKTLHVKFIQIHDLENPQAIISVLPELRFTEDYTEQIFTETNKIVEIGYPSKEAVKEYLDFDFLNSDVHLSSDPEKATAAAIWLLLNSSWKHLNLKEDWAVEYNNSTIEVTDTMLAE